MRRTELEGLLNEFEGNPSCTMFDPASEAQIKWAERRIRVKLPESYRFFLRRHDGAIIYRNTDILSISRPSATGIDTLDQALRFFQPPANLLPFANVSGEALYCFDTELKTDGEYPVKVVPYRYPYKKEAPHAAKDYCDDFVEFLNRQVALYGQAF